MAGGDQSRIKKRWSDCVVEERFPLCSENPTGRCARQIGRATDHFRLEVLVRRSCRQKLAASKRKFRKQHDVAWNIRRTLQDGMELILGSNRRQAADGEMKETAKQDLNQSSRILYLSLYGFPTPPIRIAPIGRILKILRSMHLYHLQYYLPRVTIWRTIPPPPSLIRQRERVPPTREYPTLITHRIARTLSVCGTISFPDRGRLSRAAYGRTVAYQTRITSEAAKDLTRAHSVLGAPSYRFLLRGIWEREFYLYAAVERGSGGSLKAPETRAARRTTGFKRTRRRRMSQSLWKRPAFPNRIARGKYNQNHWQRSVGRGEEGFVWVSRAQVRYGAGARMCGSKANGMAPPTPEPTPMPSRVSWASTTCTSTTCASTSCFGSTSPSTDIDALRQSQLHISSTCTMQSTVRARLRRSSDVARASEPSTTIQNEDRHGAVLVHDRWSHSSAARSEERVKLQGGFLMAIAAQ
ncbi:hypothetical protein B0H14DRAFT_3128627 [Mycena olivaceomarginata]|nr:hypothetical protein B0H14DRAFT_3128627 [Mycena olivaceomarginata]